MDQGIAHPQVYQLSLQLDQLHNQWQQEHCKQKQEKTYFVSHQTFQVKERSSNSMYQTTRGA